jgi:hypothetical protein
MRRVFKKMVKNEQTKNGAAGTRTQDRFVWGGWKDIEKQKEEI